MSVPLIIGGVTAAAQLQLQSIVVRPRRRIGTFAAQVTLEEVHTDALEITDHPVQQGASISDHAFLRPAQLVIQAAWSNSPSVVGFVDGVVSAAQNTVSSIQSLVTGNTADSVKDIYAKLLRLQESRDLFDVFTGKRLYLNMLMASLVVKTDPATENVLVVTASLRQVIVVDTKVVNTTALTGTPSDPTAVSAPANLGSKQLSPATTYRGWR